MASAEFETILADCLDRIVQGETVTHCLARYPQHAAQLEPLLAAAVAMRRLGSERMSASGRTMAHARMRRALVDSNARAAAKTPFWGHGWFRGAVGLAAAMILVLALSNALALSRPGEWGYPLRTAAERLPAQMLRAPGPRVSAELQLASHRLLDIERTVTAGGAAIGPALDALLISDETAARTAATLPQDARAAAAAQIADHAEALTRLALLATDGATQTALEQAGVYLAALATTLRGDEPPSVPPPTPTHTMTPEPTPETPAPTRTPTPTPTRPPAPAGPATVGPATVGPATVGPETPASTPAQPTLTTAPTLTRRPIATPEPTLRPTDDRGGSGRTPEATDDRGGSGRTPEPTDDNSGSGKTPEPTDDNSGSGKTPKPTDERGGRDSRSGDASAADD